MTGLQDMDPNLIRQYSGAYGPYVPGDYAIGERIAARYVSGEVIWSYRKDGTGPVTYVIVEGNDWPVEIRANEVIGSDPTGK